MGTRDRIAQALVSRLYGYADDRFRDRMYGVASPEEKAKLDATQASIWAGQMDRQMPLATRNWREKNVAMPTQEPPRYGGMTVPEQMPILDPMLLPTMTMGNDQYRVLHVETPTHTYEPEAR